MIKTETKHLNQIIRQNFIYYLLNEEIKTASVIGCKSVHSKLIIPRSIIHESQEYLVTSISKKAFKSCKHIKTIQFPKDSELRKIEKNAFFCSEIEGIAFPPKLSELEEGWCFEADKLNKIEISPENKNFSKYKKTFILGKSSPENENFDVIIFAPRNLVFLSIPNFIKIIGPFAFSGCKQFKNVIFQENSQLQIIDKYAFYGCQITQISIPPSVIKIGESAFYLCSDLLNFEIPSNSNLQIIEYDAFSNTAIQSLEIPSKVVKLDNGWRNGMNLFNIKVSPDNKNYSLYENNFIIGKSSQDNDNFDIIVSAVCSIENIINIPDFIRIIGPYAFTLCKKSYKIKFSNNSKLEIIDEYAFANSAIESICFPSNLRELRKNWCLHTNFLTEINLMPKNQTFSLFDNKFIIGKSDQNNENYDVLEFAPRDIEIVKIPSFIRIIGYSAFSECLNIKRLEINNDSKLEIIKNNSFFRSSIRYISFPPSLKQICDEAFIGCLYLKEIDIPSNSEIRTIGKYAFSNSFLEKMKIPCNLTVIEESAFAICRKLKRVDVPANSELEIISRNAFYHSAISCFKIPPKVVKIGKGAFSGCKRLQIIEIDELSQLKYIDYDIFLDCHRLMIMIPVHLKNKIKIID